MQLANTEDEIKKFAESQATQLPDYLERRGVIIVGYSGWNDACTTALQRCKQFDHNLYWCDRHPPNQIETKLRTNAYQFLCKNRENAFYVNIDDAGR